MKDKFYTIALMAVLATSSIYHIANADNPSQTVVKNNVADKAIADAIIAQYMINKNAKDLNLNVISQNGVVTLIGNIPNDDIREELEKNCQKYPWGKGSYFKVCYLHPKRE